MPGGEKISKMTPNGSKIKTPSAAILRILCSTVLQYLCTVFTRESSTSTEQYSSRGLIHTGVLEYSRVLEYYCTQGIVLYVLFQLRTTKYSTPEYCTTAGCTYNVLYVGACAYWWMHTSKTNLITTVLVHSTTGSYKLQGTST